MSSSPPDRIARWGPLVGLGLVVVLACVMYGSVFGGEIAGDDLTFHLAEATRMADCVRAGDWDMWNPSANAGYASAYYYQALPQLTPAVMAAITGTDVLPWFQLGVFLPLALAPVAAYRALRLLGTPGWAALGGAFAIVMCASNNRWGFGADGTFSVGLYTQTWALAAFPLALAHAIRWVRDGSSPPQEAARTRTPSDRSGSGPPQEDPRRADSASARTRTPSDRSGSGLAPALAWGGFVGVCHPFAGIAIGVAVCTGAARVVLGRTALVDRLAARVLPGRDVAGALREPDATPEPALAVKPAARRIPIYGALLLLAMASAWLPLFVDYAGFGGFPHRVADEIGPGFGRLWSWYVKGQLLDLDGYEGRMRVMTLLVPIAVLFGRDRSLVWMWWGAAAFVVLLGLGPNIPRTGDDLFPMVRFLGPLQICLALGIGVGAVSIGRALWRKTAEITGGSLLVFQALIAGLGTAAVVAVTIPGVRAAHFRARTVGEYEHIHRDELRVFAKKLAELPAGRKQSRWGTENHWANLLPYVDARVLTTLQMGGAGLQSSPNYDFLWNEHDPARIAWVFDAPYVTMADTEENANKLEDAETVVQTEHFVARALQAPGLVSAVQIVGPPLPAERHAARKEAIAWLKTEDALADRLRPYAATARVSLAPPADARVLAIKRQASPDDAPDIVARVHTSAATTFVVRESWHPRWRGFVDGVEVGVQRVTPDFFAVSVPAGDHKLEFRFDRPVWVWATWFLLVLVPLGVRAPPLVARAIARRRTPRRARVP